jgi:cytoskeletal protein RodZ
MPGMHAPPHHVAAAIAIVGIVVGVGIVSVVVGPKAKPDKRTPVKSAVKSPTVKSSTVESTASEASMEATAAKAASAKATTVEATSAAKAASVTTAAASVAAATTASGRHGWLNQADSRQCEQGYNRFSHHASFLRTMSLPTMEHFCTRVISAIEEHSR